MDIDAEVIETFLKRIPHNSFLGLAPVRRDGSEVVLRLPYREELIGEPTARILHGGAVTAALDATAGGAVFYALDEKRRVATLDLRIDYLKPATPDRDVFVTASCYRLTRNIAFVRGLASHEEVASDDDAIATCAATFMVFSAQETEAAHTQGAKAAQKGGFELPESAPPSPVKATPPSVDGSASERLRACQSNAELEAVAQTVPYLKALGVTLVRDGDSIRGLMRYRRHQVGNFWIGALHGGTLGALLETTAAFALIWERESEELPRIINVTIEYLRSAKAGLDTHARATIVKHGRRIATVSVVAWQNDESKPVATATCHFLLV